MARRGNMRVTFEGGGVRSGYKKTGRAGVEISRINEDAVNRISVDIDSFYVNSKWRDFHNELLSEILPNQKNVPVFFDYAFEYEYLIDKDSLGLDTANLLNNPPYIENDPEYNFQVAGYDDLIARTNPNLPETLLPSIYVFGSEVSNNNRDGNQTVYAQHITLNNRIEDVFVDILSDKSNEKIGESDSGEYFNKYVAAINKIPAGSLPEDLSKVSRKFSNVVFTNGAMNLLKDYNSRKNLFPMYMQVSFKTDSFTEVSQLLADSFLSGDLMKHVITTTPEQREISKSSFKITNQGQESVTESEVVDTWDMTRWINSIRNGDPVQQTDGFEKTVFMGSNSGENEIANEPSSLFYRKLMVTLFYSKLVEISKNRLRTMQEIFDGGLAPSEAIFYEIKKYDGPEAIPGREVQSFFFANSNEIDMLDFVDTQVKYNKDYTYQVFAYQMVLGNAYKYTSSKVTSDEVELDVQNIASYKIFKIKLNEFTNKVMDRPPVFPDIDIVPYKAVSDKILLHMNSGVGLYKMEPVGISDDDDSQIDSLRQVQKIPEGPIEFKTDDKTSAFEIYRIKTRPSSYRDFSGNRIAYVNTQLGDDGPLLSSANYVDRIVPNETYYYTFRSIDVHGHFSNPTPIYRVKMVENSGVIYPLIDVVELEPKGYSSKEKTKSGKRYVQIIPALPQTLLDEEKLFGDEPRVSPQITRFFNALPLGVQPEKVWGKNYKIRFVSKKTGRKFDVNVKFLNQGISDEPLILGSENKISLDYIRDLTRLPRGED